MERARRKALDSRNIRYGVIFAAVSILLEAGLLILTPLRLPEDGELIAPAVLIGGPVLAGALTGVRDRRSLLRLTAATAFMTAGLSLTLGTATGLLAPLLIRPLAGIAAAAVIGPAGASLGSGPEARPSSSG